MLIPRFIDHCAGNKCDFRACGPDHEIESPQNGLGGSSTALGENLYMAGKWANLKQITKVAHSSALGIEWNSCVLIRYHTHARAPPFNSVVSHLGGRL